MAHPKVDPRKPTTPRDSYKQVTTRRTPSRSAVPVGWRCELTGVGLLDGFDHCAVDGEGVTAVV